MSNDKTDKTQNAGQTSQITASNLSTELIQPLLKRHVDRWNSQHPEKPMWVLLAGLGDPLTIPGATFASEGREVAGMSQSICLELVVLNKRMLPESMLTTFFHEYGHVEYRHAHIGREDLVLSEMAAIVTSLMLLSEEGFEYLAYREAKSVSQMAEMEPYKSAVRRLEEMNDPMWRKFSKPPVEKE